MSVDKSQQPCVSLEDNFKKAVTELLILNLLSERDYYIGEITETLSQRSSGVLKIVFPYSAVYRLQKDGYIVDSEKRVAADGRKRQFYSITQPGRSYYGQLLDTYRSFISGVNKVFDSALF